MPTIDQAFVDGAAPNADAAKNGRSLVMKGSFTTLQKSDDETLLFGLCKGSGKEPYRCSADFIQPEKPVYRCSCPSRQFPCKHTLGLLYAWVQKKPFEVAEVPEEISSKREKAEVRAEKKKEREEQPRTVNKSALSKKIKAQQQGLDLLETLTHDLVRLGMGTTSAKTAEQIQEQAKQLSNAFLPGAQAAILGYVQLFLNSEGRFDDGPTPARREQVYSEALDQLTRVHALIKQGRAYLEAQLADPELKPSTDSAIAAWLGHAWQLRELRDAGLVQSQAELVQLAFNSHEDNARGEFIDTGVWFNLNSGHIQLTQNFRPFRAAKHIKADDSFFQVATISELFIYPGDVNPRIRWEGMIPRPLTSADFGRVTAAAKTDFAEVIKSVKQSIKNPLADKHPIVALRFERIGSVNGETIVEDSKKVRLVFTDKGLSEEPASCHLIPLLPAELLTRQTLICRFRHDLDTRQLRIKPLSIVSGSQIVRLTL